MISDSLPTFTSVSTLPMLSPHRPKCVAQLAVVQLDCRPDDLTPLLVLGLLTGTDTSVLSIGSNTGFCLTKSRTILHHKRTERLSETCSVIESLCCLMLTASTGDRAYFACRSRCAQLQLLAVAVLLFYLRAFECISVKQTQVLIEL